MLSPQTSLSFLYTRPEGLIPPDNQNRSRQTLILRVSSAEWRPSQSPRRSTGALPPTLDPSRAPSATPSTATRRPRRKTGCASPRRAGLVAKAVASPDELTLCEAQILCHPHGVNYDDTEHAGPPSLDQLKALLDRRKDPTPLEKLLNEAVDRLSAVRPAEITSIMNARKRQNAIEAVEMDAVEMKWRDLERARRPKVGTPWIRRMLQAGLPEDSAECWGFVVFRTGCYHGEERTRLRGRGSVTTCPRWQRRQCCTGTAGPSCGLRSACCSSRTRVWRVPRMSSCVPGSRDLSTYCPRNSPFTSRR